MERPEPIAAFEKIAIRTMRTLLHNASELNPAAKRPAVPNGDPLPKHDRDSTIHLAARMMILVP